LEKKNPPETQLEFSTKNGDECCVKKTHEHWKEIDKDDDSDGNW